VSSDRRRRVTPIAALVGVVVVLAAALWWFTRETDDDAAAPASPAPAGPPARLVVLSVTGSPNALLAVVGSEQGREPAALILPPNTTVVAPGQGEATTEEVQALPGDGMRIASSNAVGAWAEHYGALGLDALAGAIDRAGGITVELPDQVTVDGAAVGPGRTTLTGPQTAAYLEDAAPADATLRWIVILDGLLAEPVIEPGDLAESDDAEAFAGALADAAGADAYLMALQVVGGTTAIPAQPDLDELMGDLFGTPVPVPVVVENGSGEPGAGELVGARIIPEGFRIVLSGNAESFAYDVTQITATGQEHVDDAETIREALGTGEVSVTGVPSGLADVVIVTGKDLEA
jgi:hypothetical protein